jgi:hypothetical protein
MTNKILVNHIARRAIDLMRRQKIIVDGPARPVFYAWPQSDRLILVCDPEMIKNQQKILSAEFRHDLSTILAGRRVVQTNSRGIFLQIAWSPPPAPHALRSTPLDLTQQPTPLHIPIGSTRPGPFWISIIDADSILVSGRRRMGKSMIIHGCIQALIHGGQSELYLRDGKGGMEFRRYCNHPCVHLAQDNLRQALIDIQIEVNRRQRVLSEIGATSIIEYNELHPESRMAVLVLVVDEIAHIPADCRPILGDLIGRCGAYGVYPILGTTYPGHKEVGALIKANIGLKIALPVPTQSESRVILGVKGAESLPNIKGRMLFEHNARLIEGQAFLITLPDGNAYGGPRLYGIELEIAQYALQGECTLSIALLKQIYNMSEWNGQKLLKQWESRGWLEKDKNNSNARVPTALLRLVLDESSNIPKSPKSPQSENWDTEETQPVKTKPRERIHEYQLHE